MKKGRLNNVHFLTEEHGKAGDGDVIRRATLLNEDQSKTCCVRIQSQTLVSR